MRKAMLLLLSILLIIGGSSTVKADSDVQAIPLGEITLIENGMQIDLDGDGMADKVDLEILKDEDGFDYCYRLRVNDKEMTGEGWAMATKVYALKLREYHGTLLMVSDYGPSDDYETYFYLYEEDYAEDDSKLIYAGSISSLPEMMSVDGEIVTASVRGNVLCTWYHEADFAFARSLGYEEALCISVYQIPRALYPMSMIVTVNIDLPLFKDKTADSEYISTVTTGENVILCATDDREWVLIESMYSGIRGWMQLESEFGYECIIGDEKMYADAVFSDLPFAD